MGDKAILYTYFGSLLVYFSLISLWKSKAVQENIYFSFQQRKFPSSFPDSRNVFLDSRQNLSTFNAGNRLNISSSANYRFAENKYGDMQPRTVFDDAQAEEMEPDNLWVKTTDITKNISETIFSLGHLTEHIELFQPLCVDRKTERPIIFSKNYQCKSILKKKEWLESNCNSSRYGIRKELNLDFQDQKYISQFMTQHKGSIQFVRGLTILQPLDRSCGNIAHFAGRILLLQHVRNNFRIYAPDYRKIDNILLIPNHYVMSRFTEPSRINSWQNGLMKVIFNPTRFKIGHFNDFLRHTKFSSSERPQVVQLIPNFSFAPMKERQKRFVCFDSALVPGFMKGRFFARDNEYPSLHTSYNKLDIHVPRDSLILRKKANMYFRNAYGIESAKKTIVFIDRSGSARQIMPFAKQRLLKLMNRVARKAGYNFRKIKFENMTFKEQFEAMRTVSIAVGVHGANLVNAIFMPPFSVLIELNPFGFQHGMYDFGGNSGLKYYSYQMKSIQNHFKDLKLYESVGECIRLSHNCKVHYRDEEINLTDEDATKIKEIVFSAVHWCTKVINSTSAR